MVKRVCLILTAFFLISVNANAAFVYEKTPEKAKTRADLAGDKMIILAQIGSGEAGAKKSMGEDIPLAEAIRLITPDGWGAKVEKSLHQTKVSWKNISDQTWLAPLKEIGESHGIRFVVNWQTHQVAAGKGKVSKLAKETHTNGKGESARRFMGVWKLEPGSLKDQLEIWCDEAGYDLVWDNKFDYRIDAGVTFKGSFKGAVQHTVKSLYDSGARIQADLYRKNTVLYISGGKKQ